MRTSISIAVVATLLPVGPLTLASDRCPSHDAIEARANRTENLRLEFVRAYAQSAGLPDLRKLPPSPGEMHVRLWHGFGVSRAEGLVLRRTGAIWTAYVVTPVDGSECYERRELAAVTNWESIWQRVEALGLGALPSEPVRDPTRNVFDGHSYVLEWWVNGRYRAFVYDNPDVFKTPEDTRMAAIAKQLLGAAGATKPANGK
jgi:hypothetical protein